MAITQSIETIDSKLSSISVTTGQVIYVRDTQQLYFDSSTGVRYRVSDVIVVQTNSDRLAIVAPLINRLYLVVATYEIWVYDGTSWHKSGEASNSGVTAGTYKSVTVNAQGYVTAGTNPTTISGYGITNAYTKTEVDNAIQAAIQNTWNGEY